MQKCVNNKVRVRSKLATKLPSQIVPALNRVKFDNDSLRVALGRWANGVKYSEKEHGPISEWDVSRVTDMSHLFQGAYSFRGDLSKWDVSGVTDMKCMFFAVRFNCDLSKWDVSSVTGMWGMFGGATSFSGDLSNWDVSSATDMCHMFSDAKSFNGDLSKWDVSSVTNMSHMFFTAKTFNCDLSKWDVSSVTDMSDMFLNTEAFDGRLSTDHVEKMHAHGDQRTGRCLWKVARRLIKTRCIAYYWFELASRPDIHGKAPPGAIDAFCVEF